MCGINGIISKRNQNNDFKINEELAAMNHAIFHRGPDDDGYYSYDNNGIKIGMAMRRLSIIDLHSGKQPIYNDDKSLVIVYNGEIYNYKSLKESLENEGISFTTASDTEVILRLYERYGISSFSLLDGMFAFSIHDINLNKIMIARDFFGEKPLYYAKMIDSFYWASELKSIIKVLNVKPPISAIAMNLYFNLTYIPAPHTIYEDIYKLEANHYLEFDCSTFSMVTKEIKQELKNYDVSSFSASKTKIHDMVRQSVHSRVVSDVPVGTFLSGGVDSSIVSLCVAQESDAKIDTFSIGFEKKAFDESDKARTVAKLINSHHHEFIIGETDISENMERILLNFDEPFADSSALASYLVANKTSSFVKVALTGDGGDEVFGGYNKYYMGKLNTKYTKLIPENFHRQISRIASPFLSVKEDNRGLKFKINKLIKAINYENDFYYNIISLGYSNLETASLLRKVLFVSNPLEYYKKAVNNKSKKITDFRNIDKILSLEGDMLVKVDRTGMLSSLECRAPFLNKDLWNFTKSLPESFLINGWNKKYILKKAFESYFPKDFLNKSKKGFGVPVGDWLRAGLKMELSSFIEKDFVERQNIFNLDYIQPLVNNHIEGKLDNTFKVWTYYCFQKWYKNVYEKAS